MNIEVYLLFVAINNWLKIMFGTLLRIEKKSIMKKITYGFALLLFLSSCYGKKPAKIVTGNEGKLMPLIDIQLIDSNSHFSTKDVPKGRPSVVFAFEPSCPYCKAQTKSILSNIRSLKDINLYFLSTSTYHEFKGYYQKFQLANYPNIKAGIDYKHVFAQYFKTNRVPYMAIYGKDRRLKQVLMGKQYVSVIKQIALSN